MEFGVFFVAIKNSMLSFSLNRKKKSFEAKVRFKCSLFACTKVVHRRATNPVLKTSLPR
jgi:hypothetical protein